MAELKEIAKKHGVVASLATILSIVIPYFATVNKNHHEEEMQRIKYQYEAFQADSIRRNQQEEWTNNQLEKHECGTAKIDSVLKNKHKC